MPDLAARVQVSRIVDGEQAEGIAQFVVLMALRHARSLAGYEAQQRSAALDAPADGCAAQPRRRARHGCDGQRGGAHAAARGLQVSGFSRQSGQSLHAVLGGSDIVVCALPLTPQTTGPARMRARWR